MGYINPINNLMIMMFGDDRTCYNHSKPLYNGHLMHESSWDMIFVLMVELAVLGFVLLNVVTA